MSTHARPLADGLAAASDAELAALLRVRGVRPDADWNDFFDAAEALLEPASIERGLAALTRDQARALVAATRGGADAGDRALLVGTGLLDAQGRVPAPVAAAVAAHPEVSGAVRTEERSASDAEEARAAELAFTTVGALADLLLVAQATPLALVATGALSATEKRRLAVQDDVDDLRVLAELTGLAQPVDRELRVTGTAEAWLAASFGTRWSLLVTALRDALPAGVRSGAGWLPPDAWEGAHPWDDAWPDRARGLQRLLVLLGLRTEDDAEPSWARPARQGDRVETAALEALLPTEVDRIFLQNDLTAIAPGPLQPALDTRLRKMTEHESTAQVSSYRFTPDSIARALVDGEDEQSILSFLRELSLTGLPQPLEYLVSQTAARHGLVRVGPDPTGGTIVASVDAHLLEAIEVDRNLRPMGLVRSGDHLVSRVSAETVAWALSDARYPATLVDRYGTTVASRRRRVAPAAPADPEDYAELIARLRLRQGPDSDAAWLGRELEAAVRARAHVLVEVAMPDGSTRRLTLEAAGIGGGRLRGRDRTADVERTLPVRSIRSVRVLES
ncbi:helicase-associated domain-containing protein [Microbacterium soli]|uniref:Helicase XPB/Ssl2 N-terminal domain-containing protein n=1 Tax=Microbacterium soli TaxID=446075 RepID=A0ABP7ND33_9MICO